MDDSSKIRRLNSVGYHYLMSFETTQDEEDMCKAIEAYREAAACLSVEDPRLGEFLINIGAGYLKLYQKFGRIDDLQEAITTGEMTIAITGEQHAQLPKVLNNLAAALFYRFENTGGLDDLSKVIQNQQQALQLTPNGHPDLPAILSNLGNSFLYRFSRTGDLVDISEAIQLHQRAVQLTPDRHPNLPNSLSRLGDAFLARFIRTRDLFDISEAIQIQQRAVQLTPSGHPHLPRNLSSFGNTLTHRFEHTGDLVDISRAIEIHQRAVQLTPDGHHLPSNLTDLGIAFSHRFEHTGNLGDISEAIRVQQRAVQLTPVGHAKLPSRVNNLGGTYLLRFNRTGDMVDISEAIQNQQRVVLLTPDGHPDLPGRLINLGNALLLRFERTGDSQFLSSAVSNFRLAATSSTGPPSVRLDAAERWANHSRQSPLQFLDANACIIGLLSLVSGLENTIQRRYKTLVESSRLSISASTAALSLDCPDEALEWLVEGRCIVWNQINRLRTSLDELRAHDQALAERLSDVSRELESAASRSESRTTEITHLSANTISLEKQAGHQVKLAKERDQLLTIIRNIAGFEDFLQPRKCADIMRDLPDEGAVVIIIMHTERCDALALMSGAGAPMHIPLPNFCYQEAKRLAKDLRRYLLGCGAIMRLGSLLVEDSSPRHILSEVLQVLWSDVVKPILEALAFSVTDAKFESSEKLPRLWWCPTGPLAFLPIHAAGIYRDAQGRGIPMQCLSDFAVSSYIPTVNAFKTSGRSNSVKKLGDVPTGLLVVSQPNTPGRSPIPYVEKETKNILNILEQRGISSITLDDQNGTVGGVLKAMESFSCIHLACHASQNMRSPVKSSVYLHDGQLELLEIMKKNLPYSDFAFLSACQTSTGDENLPDEVVHLAAGMLAAGYRSVIGTMWSTFDMHGPDVAEFFYEGLLNGTANESQRIDGSGAARALHHAMQRIREKLSDSPQSLLVWVPYVHIGI